MAFPEGLVKGPMTEVRPELKEPGDAEAPRQGLTSRNAVTMLGRGSGEEVVSAGVIEEGLLGRTREPDHSQRTEPEEGALRISTQLSPPPSLTSAVPSTCQPIRKPETNGRRCCLGLLCALGARLALPAVSLVLQLSTEVTERNREV